MTAATRLLDVDLALLHPGDLAVTSDGLHVLAYLGDAAEDYEALRKPQQPVRVSLDDL